MIINKKKVEDQGTYRQNNYKELNIKRVLLRNNRKMKEINFR